MYEGKYPLNEEAVPTDNDDHILAMASAGLDIAVETLFLFNGQMNDLVILSLAFVARYGRWRQMKSLPENYIAHIRKVVGADEWEEEDNA